MTETKITVGWEGHLEPLAVTVPDGEPPPWDARSELSVVGQRTPRLDGAAKVTGRAKYTWDINLPGLLHARVVRSRHPAARLVSVDASAAKRLPGVKAVWTERAGRRIFFAGQEVAAVAATTPEIAEDALALIRVEYQPQPWVVDAGRARAPDAPLVFPGDKAVPEAEDDYPGARTRHEGNVRTTTGSHPKGVDIDKAFAAAEVVIERTFRTQVQTHSALETHGSVARWDGAELTLWSSTQATFGVRDQVAEALRLPKKSVRVLCEHMGGGFGAKFSAGHWSIIAARLARDAGAPVKLMLDRKAEHLATGNRPDSVQWLKLGARRDGTLVALHLKSYGTPGVGTGAGTGGPARAIYKIPSWQTEEQDVFTNTGAAQPFRAPGHPQGCFALEQAIDELAEKLGMDPVELRKKNLTNPVQAAELDRAIARVAAWRGRKKAGSSTETVRRGVGLACGVWYKIVSTGTQVQIDVHDDGRVEVLNGAQDIGTGTRTIMAQVAAEELGLPLAMVTVSLGDTSWPVGPGSGGSCTAASIAPAVRTAAFQARQKMIAIAAKALAVKPADVELRDGKFQSRGKGASRTWKQVAARVPGGKLTIVAGRSPDYQAMGAQTGGVQIAEVEVDTATGRVRIVRVTAVHDFGRPLNRMTAESQINGGVIQGVSYALFEDRVLDGRLGQMVNADLESYKIATANDCPEIDVVLLDVANGGNATGTVGLGEPPTVPTAAAIANAVYNATGARMLELPMTPARVLAALGGGRR
jgi:xanthine dehydrogenase YagR molybdenum-binding subunit